MTENNGIGIELPDDGGASQSEDAGGESQSEDTAAPTFKKPSSKPPPLQRGPPDLMPTPFPIDFEDYELPIYGAITARTPLGRMRKLRKLMDWDKDYAKQFMLANRSKFL